MLNKIKNIKLNYNSIKTSTESKSFNYGYIFRFIFIVSPILVSSLFFPFLNVPYYIISSCLAMIFGIMAATLIYFVNQKISIISLIFIFISFILSIVLVFIGEYQGILFSLFGYNFSDWTIINILILSLLFAYLFDNDRITKTQLFIVALPVIYTVTNMILNKYSISSLSFLNIPASDIDNKYNYLFVYSVVALIAVISSFFVNKKGYKIIFVDIKGWLKVCFFVILSLFFINITMYTLKVVAFSKYISSIEYIKSKDILFARKHIDQAINIMPSDLFYISSIIIRGYEFQKIIAIKPTDQEAIKQMYKDFAQIQIQEAMFAIDYNPYNYKNYLVLANLYSEKYQVLKDDSYLKALDYYNKSISLLKDDIVKSEIENLKARVYFISDQIELFEQSLQKALNFNPKSRSALFLKAQYLAKKGQYKESIDLSLSILEGEIRDLEIYKHIAITFFEQKQYAEAARYFLLIYRDSGQKDIQSLYNAALSIKNSNSNNRDQDFNILIDELQNVLGVDNPALIQLKSDINLDLK